MIALAPDGQRIAYTRQDGRDLTIVTRSIEPPGPKWTIKIDPDRDSALLPGDKPQAPTQLRFLRWATPIRLVFAPVERVVPLPPVTDKDGRLIPNPDGPTIISPILAADADGRQRGTLVDARDFQETPADARRTLADLLRTTKELQAAHNEPVRWRMPHLDVLGFLPSDREQLVLQTRGGYSVPMQRLVDIRTGHVREFGGDWPTPPGPPHVFDWFRLKIVGERKDVALPTTVWRDEELARVQRELELKFPRRIVEILDWSETRTRVLFRVTGGSDPGRAFVYQRPEDIVLEIVPRAPWLSAAKLNETRFFQFEAPDGAQLSGYLTWPRNPRLTPLPLLVVFPTGFPGRAQLPFDPEAQVFADWGLVVVRLNHRCIGGMRTEDLSALRAAIDRVSVHDAQTVIQWIASRYSDRPLDSKRIASLGRGFGGYLAVRSLQIAPAMFRCGIAIDAPMDLRLWLRRQEDVSVNPSARPAQDIPASLIDHQSFDWKNLSVSDQAGSLTNPVLLLVEPGDNAAIDASTDELRAKLQSLGRTPEYVELDPGFAAATPTSRAVIYRKIEEFLNLRLYDYAVKIGPTKEVP